MPSCHHTVAILNPCFLPQYWYLTSSGLLIRDFTCLGPLEEEAEEDGSPEDLSIAGGSSGSQGPFVGTRPCSEAGTWTHPVEDLTLRHWPGGRCAEMVEGIEGEKKVSRLVLRRCLGEEEERSLGEEGRARREAQVFVLSRYKPEGLRLEELARPVDTMGAKNRRKQETGGKRAKEGGEGKSADHIGRRGGRDDMPKARRLEEDEVMEENER